MAASPPTNRPTPCSRMPRRVPAVGAFSSIPAPVLWPVPTGPSCSALGSRCGRTTYWWCGGSTAYLQDLLGFVNALDVQGIRFVSLTEQMDTTTPTGRLVFQIFGALVEYERGLIRERALTGRTPRVMAADKLQTAQTHSRYGEC